jgi:hypothetical protein
MVTVLLTVNLSLAFQPQLASVAHSQQHLHIAVIHNSHSPSLGMLLTLSVFSHDA